MFFKYSCRKPLKKVVEDQIVAEFQAAINFLKVSLHFNKIPNYLRDVLQIYSQICIFCGSSQRKLISKCQGNLVVKLTTLGQ